jgi:hypothetical protein
VSKVHDHKLLHTHTHVTCTHTLGIITPKRTPEGFTIAQSAAKFNASILPAPIIILGISPQVASVARGTGNAKESEFLYTYVIMCGDVKRLYTHTHIICVMAWAACHDAHAYGDEIPQACVVDMER